MHHRVPRSKISKICSGGTGISNPCPCCLQRVWQHCTETTLQEKQSWKYAMSCQSNGDVACMVLCGTWTQVYSYPEPDRSLSWFCLSVGCKIPWKVMAFWATWSKTKSTSQYGLKCFQKSQPAATSSPDSSTDPVCKQTVCIIAIYVPLVVYLTLCCQTSYCAFFQTGCLAATFPKINLCNYK